MDINYILSRVQRTITEAFKEFNLDLDRNVIDGDFVKFAANLTLGRFGGANVYYIGNIGNHGFGHFEAVFDEVEVNEDSLRAVNDFNNYSTLAKAYISTRGPEDNPHEFLVLARSAQFVDSEDTMCHIATQLLSDLIDDGNEPYIRKMLSFLKRTGEA